MHVNLCAASKYVKVDPHPSVALAGCHYLFTHKVKGNIKLIAATRVTFYPYNMESQCIIGYHMRHFCVGFIGDSALHWNASAKSGLLTTDPITLYI